MSTDCKSDKVFDTLGWLTAICSHRLDRREQMVREYGRCSGIHSKTTIQRNP